MRFTPLPLSTLRLTGADRIDFLQGQMTANLKSAETPSYLPALFLNVRGQIEFFGHLYRSKEAVYIYLNSGEAPQLMERFKKYIVFDQVEVSDISSESKGIHLWKEDREAIPSPLLDLSYDLQGPPTQVKQWKGQELLIAQNNRTGTVGWDIYVPHTAAQDLASFLSTKVEQTTYLQLQKLRIEGGIPDPFEDRFLGDLPQDCGMEHAISYGKGCYIGQEIVARLEARGQSKHHLVQLEGHTVPEHSPIQLAGKSVGKTGASTGTTAIALLRKEIPMGTWVEINSIQAQVKAHVKQQADV